MSLTLRVLTGEATGRVHVLAGPGTVLIGRSTRCGLMLPSGAAGDLLVSHAHALVEYNPPACRVYDLNARNGTRVNGAPATVGDVAAGDVLTVGATRIRVEVADPAPGTATYHPSPEVPPDTFDAATVHPAAAPAPAAPPSGPRALCAACRRERPRAGSPMCAGCERSEEALPQPIPGFRLVREVGRGGMGIVYLAVRAADHKRVAVKTILTQDSVRPSQLAKFLRETDILRRLRHPHVVRFRDGGMMPGGAFLAMDYVHGLDLNRVLARSGPLTVGNAVRAVRNALAGLTYAHDRGFVHRDLKPANLILEVRSRRQSVKITDFGLARVYHATQMSGLTLAGEVGGTPQFLPPEQIADFRGAAPCADQYAMGATLYALLTGRPPYDLSGPIQVVLAKIQAEDPVPVLARKPDLPAELATVIHTAMARHPAGRFPSAAAFRAALEPFAGAG